MNLSIIIILLLFVYFFFDHTRITFDTTEDCYEWSRLITTSESSLKRLDDIFAFQYYDSLMAKEDLHEDEMVVVNGGISSLTCSSVSTSLTKSSKKIKPGTISTLMPFFYVFSTGNTIINNFFKLLLSVHISKYFSWFSNKKLLLLLFYFL